MIVGIGTDMVDIRRMQALLERFGERLQRKLFTAAEIAQAENRIGQAHAAFFASRFAAKEAFAKAVGSGMRGLSWQDIAVEHDDAGRPLLQLGPRASRKLTMLVPQGTAASAHLSLTHEYPYAQAMVILEAR